MAFNHGISVTQADTSLSAPVIAASGIPFAVGTAPIHTVGGKANEVIMCGTYAQAAAALGYSGDWKTYTLCEVMVSHFKLFGMAPVVFVNVLDPEKHKKAAEAKSYELKDGKAMLPAEAIKSTVKADAYTEGEDYGLFYSDEGLVLEVLPGGAIPDGTASLNIGFDAADPSMVTEADIIGGFDIAAKRTTGLELIDAVFPKYGIAPDLIIAPGWSGNPAVAAVMGAKAMNINGTFEAKALIDADSKTVNHYMDVAAWKKKNNIFSKTQILCWPMVKQGGQTFHMSTQLAGRMAATDADNDGCPAESPSNKPLMMDSAVLDDATDTNAATEVLLDVQQANVLNSAGIVTAINFIGGYVAWGNQTACFPADTDIKNNLINVSRMMAWLGNSIVLSYWSRLDGNMIRRWIDAIADSVNIWLNGLTAEGKLLGGRIEFLEEENPDAALAAGQIVFHIYAAPPSPGQHISFVIEYDMNYIAEALGG